MSRMLFVNLPVADVAASRSLFTGLGFDVDETFSDETAISVVHAWEVVGMDPSQMPGE